MPKKSIPILELPESKPINCEVCRHFNGYAYKFVCDKGHEPQQSWTFLRDSCADNSPLRRDELIFKRFKLFWSGGEQKLKNKKAVVRRTSTSLRAAMTEFEKVLDSEQIAAMKAAANAFDRLGDDIGRAAELAKQYEANEKAKYEKERQDKLDGIASEYLGIAGPATVLEIVRDMSAFIGTEGRSWYKPISGDKQGYIAVHDRGITLAIHEYESNPSEKNFRELKTWFAKNLEELQRPMQPAYTANLNHFEQFRAWRAQQREIARLAAADPTIVQFKPKTK